MAGRPDSFKPLHDRPQKITFAEMRESGVASIFVASPESHR
jgi:hypothetical protein